MSNQIPLFVDDYHDAVRHAVEAMGGFKRIGHDMKPDMTVEAAGRWLADCCNPDKREKLSLSELAYIRKAARQAGVHVLAAYEAQAAGYAEPQPINPEDEAAQLQREFIASVKALEALQARMARTHA
ncbi:hypothetical protein [Pseudoxanthomonas dokdonensis]|nr:hypothetical protein [Pseudoxanthomonas dokdonensis]